MPSDRPTPITTAPPDSAQLNDYDRANVATYLKVLDADTLRVDWRTTARTVLAFDVDKDSTLARCIYDAHLARAHWMTTTGYKLLLAERPHPGRGSRLGQGALLIMVFVLPAPFANHEPLQD
jgi:hypothetical protein